MLANAKSFVQKMVVKVTAAAHTAVHKAEKAADVAKHIVQDKVIPAAQKAAEKAVAAKQAIQTRTVQQVKKAVAAAKQIASATKKVADEKVWCPLKKAWVKGRDGAKAANAQPAKWGMETPKPDMFNDSGPKLAVGGALKREGKTSLLVYGDDNNKVRIATLTTVLQTGYEFDPLEKSEKFTLIKAEASVSAMEAERKREYLDGLIKTEASAKLLSAGAGGDVSYTKTADGFVAKAEAKAEAVVFSGSAKGSAGGLLEGELSAEVLSARASASAAIVKDAHGAEAKVEAGAEAVLAKVSGKGAVTITPKSIYDNTIGAALNFVTPGSEFAKLPDSWDHGIVIGAEGEAGIGAAAKAEASAGVVDGVYRVSAGLTVGAGPMAGVKAFLGFK